MKVKAWTVQWLNPLDEWVTFYHGMDEKVAFNLRRSLVNNGRKAWVRFDWIELPDEIEEAA